MITNWLLDGQIARIRDVVRLAIDRNVFRNRLIVGEMWFLGDGTLICGSIN